MALFATDDKFADVVTELERRGWRRLPFVGCPKFDLKWTNYSRIAWTRVKPQQIVNHLQHSILFSQKDQFTDLLYKHTVDQIQVDGCFPRTFNLSRPQDWRLFKCWFQYSEAVAVLQKSLKTNVDTGQVDAAMDVARTFISHKLFEQEVVEILDELGRRDPQFHAIGTDNVWICKPSNLSQGRGIVLSSSTQEIEEIASPGDNTKWIVQKYIERPLLMQHGRKFDIRQWVLITELEPNPTAFWFYRSYLRFCSRKFNLTRLQDRFTHLSNYSVQQYFVPETIDIDQPDAEIPDASHTDNKIDAFESMWHSDQFRDSLRLEHGRDMWVESILPQMQNTARLALDAVLPKLKVVGRGFEWLGFDFLVDEDFQVYLLEVNVSPDVSHSTSVTSELVPKATADALNGGLLFFIRFYTN
ncbi:Tubulin-tyrosine ligase [Phytophthora megakarya]|uniref:Tubulin-tyrosine ligase n=1 Tax=Phytophthora megakarya TaxID=4795 RepID=A0A225VPT9_9STRA|nr:Tubulin-tyrosine ligase [Phytophthora megakarya]